MHYLNKMLPQTLKMQLRIALFSIGFFPYLFILLYSHNLAEKKILDNTLVIHHAHLSQIKKRIEKQLISLEKEIHFLASLDMMNDMIVGDIDKRIAKLLIQKEQDLSLDIHLFTLTPDYTIIASSDRYLQHQFKDRNIFNKTLKKRQHYFFTDKHLVIFTPIVSRLQKNQLLGYLFMEYSLGNLKHYLEQKEGIRSMLSNPEYNLNIGEVYDDIALDFKGDQKDYLNDRYLVLYEQFTGILSQWSLVYMIKKSIALTFLDDFILFVWTLFALGLIVIAVISLWISKGILDPISRLSKATKAILSTQDYTTQVSITSKGEITQLADDFNTMIREINHAFGILEEENKLRLLRFIQLINIFNSLTQTKSEEECIALAINELQGLMPQTNFSFSSDYPKVKQKTAMTQYMILSVTDFEKHTHDFYGVISFKRDAKTRDPHEEKFYRAIATMIMLQLDQIRLIEQTQAISHAKSTFISHMSHELRTPLHTILSSTQYLIAYENLTHQQQEIISTMESSADHLLGIINDILDLVQIEAGKVSISPIYQNSDDIETLTQEVISMLELLVQYKEVNITLSNIVSSSVKVRIDYRFLKQILINLLSNAIKFTVKGSIDFYLKEDKNSLWIIIQDSGIGISKHNLALLFDDFTQVKNIEKNQQKGSGLGLAISRKLAHLFDADILLESEGIGQGTKAIIKLKKV